jgi:MoaA/NifB/PqqE/SkfB family radical SAM enzyme
MAEMELDKPNPASNLMLFKKELWITDYSTRMQRWLSGERLPPVRIDAEIHRRCNLCCIHCVRRSFDRDLSRESEKIEIEDRKWLEAADESGKMGVKLWNIAGIGEPMCKPSLLMRLMKVIKRHRMFGELTTNGTLWKDSDIESAVRLGWDSVNISIDSPREEVHDKIRGVKGTFAKAKHTVEMFSHFRKKHRRQNPAITINMVLSKLNYGDLPAMVEFASRIGADALFVEPMIVHSELGRSIRLDHAEASRLKPIIEKAERLAYQKNVMTFITCLQGDDERKELNKELVEKAGEIKSLIEKSDHSGIRKGPDDGIRRPDVKDDMIKKILDIPCYYPWFYMIINADGSAIHCGECQDLKENIKRKGISEIWYGPHFQSLRERFLSSSLPEYCNKCRPNVISDMQIVRKSIREYADVGSLQGKLIQLFRDNISLKEQVHYARSGIRPPSGKQGIFDKINLFRF